MQVGVCSVVSSLRLGFLQSLGPIAGSPSWILVLEEEAGLV